MARDFLLILRTRETMAQQAFREQLEQAQIAFRELYFQFGPAEAGGDIFVENLYMMEADFSSLSTLKQRIEKTIHYDALLLFEYMSW